MITLTGGAFTDPKGTAVALGKLRLELSQDAKVAASNGQIAPLMVDIALNSSGSIASNTAIYGNDELTPSGTYYRATVYDANNGRVYGPQQWSLTGGGTLNVGSMTPSSTSLSYSNPVLLTPVAAQTITGYPLYVKNINSIRYADQFAGADAGAKIAAAIADLPSTGGTVDARGLEGSQTISSLITITTPITILFGNANYTCSAAQSFQISSSSVSLIGCGVSQGFARDGLSSRGTIFKVSTANATFAVIGSDNGHAYDAGDYDGFEGTKFANFQVVNTGAATALNNGKGSYGNGSYAIRDWRGGGIEADNISITHFNYGFWGINSDINSFSNSFLGYNKFAMYLGPRSDQNTLIHLTEQFNDTALQLDSVKHMRAIACQFVGNGSTTPDYGIIVGSTFAWGGSRGNAFLDCWFEQYDPTAITAHIGVGAGDSFQSIDTRVIRPHIVAAGASATTSFMTIDNAEYIDVIEPCFYRNGTQFTGGFFRFIGTTSPVNVQLTQFAFNTFTVYQNAGSGSPNVTIIKKDQNSLTLDYQAGAAATSSIIFSDLGTAKYSLQKTSSNAFQIFDNANSAVRFFIGTADTIVNARGSGAVKINSSVNMTGNGLEVWSGGAVPAKTASIDGTTGLGTFNGGIKAASTGTAVKQMQLFTALAVDPGSIAATTRGSIAVTVPGTPGIAAGDVIIPVQGINGINDDLVFEGVTATGANQVTFFFYNPTAGAIDDTSHNWDIMWMDVT